MIELYRLLAVGISLWNQFAVPVLFSVFWFVLFVVQLCSDAMSGKTSAGHQGIMLFLLTRCDVTMWIINIPLCTFCKPTYPTQILFYLKFVSSLPPTVSLNAVPLRTPFWV